MKYLQLGSAQEFTHHTYRDLASRYKTAELTSEHEKRIEEDFGRVAFIEYFPEETSPFWNMNRTQKGAAKIDVIIDGIETIGSAERSTDPEDMRRRFKTISDGEYADLLFRIFGQERVEAELEQFLALSFFPRFGGGIGMTRMMRALEKSS